MASLRKSPLEFHIEDLDRELIARVANTGKNNQSNFKDKEGTPAREAMISAARELYEKPPTANEALADFSTREVVNIVIFKTRSSIDINKGEGFTGLMDWYDMEYVEVDKIANCTGAVMFKECLLDEKNGFSTLKVKKYGKTFNLCDNELFRDQPISSGLIFTGFLVKNDVFATVGHHIHENNVTDLRIVFGYKMSDAYTAVTRFSNEDIYRGVKILHKGSNAGEGDWALLKLDREVAGRSAAELAEDNISSEQTVDVIGHPLGLPLKYAAEINVCDDTHETCFGAELTAYSGGSGSPVFDSFTHKVIGMVRQDVYDDFRWTGKCWISINYSRCQSDNCVRISNINDFVRRL